MGSTTKTLARKKVEEYCRKYPDTPTLTLAKKLYKKYPDFWMSLERCRGTIRQVRGNSGQLNRNQASDKSLFRENGNTDPFKVPESFAKKVDRFRLPKSIKKVLFLTDIHFPFHDEDALVTALKYGKEQGIDCIYLNGDILDIYDLSFHEKDPRKVRIKDELEMAREFLAMLRKDFDVPIYWVDGNHEHRIMRWLRVKAPEWLDCDEFRLDVLLRMGEHGVTYLGHMPKVYFGKLLVEHGDKLRGAGGVQPARTLLLKFKRPTICGHFHRTSEALHSVYDDDPIIAYSVGCLCELEPSYMPVNEWNHGFAIIEVDEKGEFRVHNHKIVNGKVF